jgi:hypothetical protein
VPIVGDDVDLPIDIVCTREIVEVGVPIVRVAAVPTIDCVEVPIAGIDDGELVEAPIVGVVDVPIVESDVPIAGDDVVSSVCEPVVEAEPNVPSEVRAGRVAAAEAPTPNLAAKELKSVVAPKPRVASKASNSGSGAVGTMTAVSLGNVNVGLVGAGDAVVTTPPSALPELNVEDCANATPGIATSATGAIHPMILFISPPCRTPYVNIDHGRARVVPRVRQPAYRRWKWLPT